MTKAIVRILANSVSIASADQTPPVLVEIGTTHDALRGTLDDLVDNGFIEIDDLLSLVIEQINRCDVLSINHVLPKEKLIDLIKKYNHVAVDTIYFK